MFDGWLYPLQFSPLNSHIRSEISSTGAESSLQGFLLTPFSLLKLNMGPRLAFAGCILTERCTLETFSAVASDFHVQTKHMAFLLAISHLDTLSDRYSKAGPVVGSSPDSVKSLCSGPIRQPRLKPLSQDVALPYASCIFPHPTTFTSLTLSVNPSLSFTYDAELEEKKLFFHRTNEGSLEAGSWLLSKF